MKKISVGFILAAFILLVNTVNGQTTAKMEISRDHSREVIKELLQEHGSDQEFRIIRGVNQVASLWNESDGSVEDFKKFCNQRFIGSDAELEQFFDHVSTHYEVLYGHFLSINKKLKRPLHLDMGEIMPIDMMFGSYNASAHLTDDFFNNKIAFVIALNFPFYSLEEKSELGKDWSRKEWAYARVGDMYTSRVPARLKQHTSKTLTEADSYISDYNIYMGNLVNEDGETYFPKDLKLITHWGLRDELKSNYAEKNGLKKQEMIYTVMQRIIDQSIPEKVINKDEYNWNPYQNTLYKKGKKVDFEPENNTRYKVLLDNFTALQATDKYHPHYPTYIKRKFEEDMEIPQEEVEQLFIDFVSSPVVKQVGELISQRLGRELRPFDIWYDGFKARSSISEDKLDAIVSEKYPTKEAFENDLANLLIKLEFEPEKAKAIASKIQVDASRGAGHAWGAAMKDAKAHLRTRVSDDGMDYKGYNIAIHEFGHTVEQTITLQDVDYYFLNGVPNTAFTEALAFIFQKRDLELLGLKEENPEKEHLMALDNFWSTYEIMGVSLVDMNVWKWLYKHPDASPQELKNAVIDIAKDVWNKYYAPVFGSKNEPILAIYSHMIDNPLYLSAYPIGHLIDFQIEQQLEGKNFAKEIHRIYTQGRIIPQLWMEGAVGHKISNEPTIEAARNAVKVVGK